MFRSLLIASSLLVGTLVSAQEYPFQNPDLPLEQRLEDLIDRMTLEEKVGQLLNATPAIERLGIPKYDWWNECLHGVARNGRATIFPQAIGLAATWDTTLIRRIGDAIGNEGRAKYNLAVAHQSRERYQGLTFWSPNVNIFRDPRWGRGQETYGEDPYLTARIGVAFVNGLQGTNPNYLKAAGMAKHYAVHNGPEKLRHGFDAIVSQKDLWETYLPAFEALVIEAKVEGVMGAYNRLNGIPCCAHPYLIHDVLREQWGFEGYFVSDCGAVADFHEGHKVTENAAGSAALALNNGCNLNCGSTYGSLQEAIAAGLTTEEMIDENLRELLPTRFRLGLFDPIGMGPFDHLGAETIHSDSHIALTREAAAKSIVLLKNKDHTLPIAKDVSQIFVTGPIATHAQALLANYYGVSENLVTFLEGIVGGASPQTSVKYAQGALLDEYNRNPQDWFSGNASNSEVTVVCLGISQLIEGEEGESIASRYSGDRQEVKLPQNQIDFLKVIREKAKKLVVVITGGSAISCPEVYEMADALLYAWYPGEQGGNALADVLFGNVSPSGRLPVTVVKSIEDLPPFEDYALKGRTYRYLNTEPLFPFGFGLSYVPFEYRDLQLSSAKISQGQTVTATVTITNKGETAAEEVVQLYIKDLEASVDVPLQSLRGFQRIALEAGESTIVSFTVKSTDLQVVNNEGERVLEAGDFLISVGGAMPSQRSIELGAAVFQQASLTVK